MKRRTSIRNIAIPRAVSFLPALILPAPDGSQPRETSSRSATKYVWFAGRQCAGPQRQLRPRARKNGFQRFRKRPAPDHLRVRQRRCSRHHRHIGRRKRQHDAEAPKRGQVLAAAEDLVGESNREDEVFVLNFNDSVKRGLPEDTPFSDNIPQLRAALNREHPAGKTALYDAVADGLKQLEAGRRGRKTLVVVSDGGDNVSMHKRAETIDLVERSAASIFTIGLFNEGEYDADPGILRQFAKISGGEAFLPKNLDGVSDACHRIAKEIRTRCTIGYLPPLQNGSEPLRHIQVKVLAPDRNGLTALTRTSYRYDQPQTQ